MGRLLNYNFPFFSLFFLKLYLKNMKRHFSSSTYRVIVYLIANVNDIPQKKPKSNQNRIINIFEIGKNIIRLQLLLE